MNRDQLIRALRKYARKNGLVLEVDTKKGKGSHYRVKLNGKVTTIQSDLNPGRVERALKPLGLSPADL